MDNKSGERHTATNHHWWHARYMAFAALVVAFPGRQLSPGNDPQTFPLSTEQIVSRLAAMDARRVSDAQPYTAIRHYSVDYKGFPSGRHAEMVVKVVSTPPQKQLMIVSESGSKLLINRVLRKLVESEREASDGANRQDTKLKPENYDFYLLGKEVAEGRECYVLQVTPKKKNKFLYVGKIWVDTQDFAVVRISAKPARNPSFWISSVEIEHRYAKHGGMWLPQTNRSTSKVRLGGRSVLTIDYGKYEFAPATGRIIPCGAADVADTANDGKCEYSVVHGMARRLSSAARADPL